MQILRQAVAGLMLFLLCNLFPGRVHAAKMHFVTLGAVRKVPYTPPEATPDNKSEEATTLRIRPLVVDDKPREWTVGELHEVTDRTFVIRRALRINDSLPGEAARWSWQPGPWLQVDRTSGHITPLHLPDFDPQISDVVWFRDYAAYCGLVPTLKGGVVALVVELGSRKAVAQRVLANWPLDKPSHPVCAPSQWQRTPMRATLSLSGGQPITFDVAGTSSLVEEGKARRTNTALLLSDQFAGAVLDASRSVSPRASEVGPSFRGSIVDKARTDGMRHASVAAGVRRQILRRGREQQRNVETESAWHSNTFNP